MGRTFRTARIRKEGGELSAIVTVPDGARHRADRDERLRRSDRDAKRIDRNEQYTERHDDAPIWPLGSTVRAVA